MSKFGVLVKQVYQQKILAKSFWVMLGIYLIVISGIMFWPNIKVAFFESEAIKVALVNETNLEMETLFKSNEDIEYIFPRDETTEVEKQVVDGEFAAAIFIKDQEHSLAAEIATYEPLTFNDQMNISSSLQYAGKLYEVQQMNLTAEQAEKILQSEPIITMKNLNEQAELGKSEGEKAAGIGISILVGGLIYSFLMTFLSMITTDVASEKGSRVLEVLLASVKPSTHYIAKLTGTFLLAVTQMVILFLALGLLFSTLDGGSKIEMVQEVLQEVSSSYLIYAAIYLFQTIILYLIVGALLGSLVSKVEESGQAIMPMMILGLVGFYVLIFGASSPDTMLIKVFSYIPFTAGMVMPLRIGATDIAGWEPMLSVIVLVATILILFAVSLSFYKRSVLTYSSGGLIEKIKTVLKMTT